MAALIYRTIESLYVKTTLNYQKIENVIYENTFKNAAVETFNKY